jgi:hypothetical protein
MLGQRFGQGVLPWSTLAEPKPRSESLAYEGHTQKRFGFTSGAPSPVGVAGAPLCTRGRSFAGSGVGLVLARWGAILQLASLRALAGPSALQVEVNPERPYAGPGRQ